MKKKIIFLPVEIPERELDSKLLLAHEALERGYDVYIGHYARMPRVALQVKSGIYLYKAMTDFNAKKLFSPLKVAGIKCASLDEEGLVWPSLEYYGKTRLGNGDSLQILDAVLTWGGDQRQWIIDNYPVDPEKVFTTGNPRFDILRAPWNEKYDEEADYIVRKYGSFVLVNTNFGPANFSGVFGRTWLEHMRWVGIIKSDEDARYYEERSNYYRELMDEYLSAVKILARKIYPTNIIVRPHPSENHETWQKELSGIENIFVLFEGSSKPWIKASSCVIHTGCTTGLEAFGMGRHVIRYNPTNRDDMESDLPNMVSHKCVHYGELEKSVLAILSGRFEIPERGFKIAEVACRVENIKGSYSIDMIMDVLDRIPIEVEAQTVYRRNWAFVHAYLLKRNLTSFFVGLLSKNKRFRELGFVRAHRWRTQRFSGLSRSYVQNSIAFFSGLGKRHQGYVPTCTRVDVDVYKISADG